MTTKKQKSSPQCNSDRLSFQPENFQGIADTVNRPELPFQPETLQGFINEITKPDSTVNDSACIYHIAVLEMKLWLCAKEMSPERLQDLTRLSNEIACWWRVECGQPREEAEREVLSRRAEVDCQEALYKRRYEGRWWA